MVTKSFFRSEVASRAALVDCPSSLSGLFSASGPKPLVGASTLWLSELLSYLDAVGSDVSDVCSVFSTVSDREKLSEVCYELSCIPVWYRLCSYMKFSANGMSSVDAFGVRSVSGETIEVGSARCPQEVMPSSMDRSSYNSSRCVQ